MRAKSGFTLVEILIVVVILGILAAIVIPQFTGASTEAKESSLVSNLQSIRSQIELFKIQHNDLLPGETMDAIGTKTAADAVSFVNAMCLKTDQYGVEGTGDTFRFGPYMKKLPVNPFSNATGETVVGTDLADDGAMVAVGASKLITGGSASGWHFVYVAVDSTDADHGLFQAADPIISSQDGTTAHVDY